MSAEKQLRPSPRHWVIVFWAVFACSWCGNQFSPLLIQYKSEQHYSTLIVNAFLGIYVIGLAPALLLAGALSDRFGRKPLLVVALISAILASLVLALGELGIGYIFVGRLLSGITVGSSLAVGSSWIKELSQGAFDPGADAGSGARRSSLAFTLGAGAGALVAGGIAQFTPFGEVLPFIIHIAFTAPFFFLIFRVPETSFHGVSGSFLRQLAVPAASHRRFRRVVLVAGPWIFAGAAIAYGYLPVLLAPETGKWGLGYATMLGLITLGAASAAQPIAKRIDSLTSARGITTGLIVTVVGLVAAALTLIGHSLILGVVTSIILGLAMGLGLVTGLMEVQRIATGKDLAGLTGVFYAVAYLGFLTPSILSAITPPFTAVALLLVLAVLAFACVLVIGGSFRKHLPPK